MGRAVICDCLPWLAFMLLSGACLWLVVRLNDGRFELRRLLWLHRDEVGSAQSLSFVLTLPFFVVIVLFIVQLSQLMIGTIVVHYAAFAAARAAIVWIPVRLGPGLSENCVDGYALDPDDPNPVPPNYIQPGPGGMTYILSPSGLKYEKIARAAYLACLPICPSRNVGGNLPSSAATEDAIRSLYQTLAPGTSLAAARVRNKLAYAMNYTQVEVRFYHDNSEPPLQSLLGGPYNIPYGSRVAPDLGRLEFQPAREIGWQDPITVTVTHYLALLPGPGRIFANKVRFVQTSRDSLQQEVEQDTGEAQAPSNLYVYKLSASCTLGNEGEKSVLPYDYLLY